MQVRQANGDLRSVVTDGTCLNFLTPAACASLMGASEATWFRWGGYVVVGRVWFSAFLGGRVLVLVLLLGKLELGLGLLNVLLLLLSLVHV